MAFSGERLEPFVKRLPLILCILGALQGKFAAGQDIIVNGTFDKNVSGWSLDPGFGTFQWSSDGTLLLTNDAAPGGQTASVSQCDLISAGVSYGLSAKVQPLNFGQGGPNSSSGLKRVEHTGSLYILLSFFPLDGCRGSALSQFVRVDSTGANAWQALGQSFFAPAMATSVLTSLAILKNQPASDLQAEFDEISITAGGGPPPPPDANFSYSPISPFAGATVQFADTSFFNPTTWSWNFGDPGSAGLNTASVQNPAHLFSTPGVFTVTLDASNAGGSSTRTHTVTVATVPPVANFTFTPAVPAPGQVVQFNDTSTGAPATWSWTFGDPDSGASNTSASRNPSHVFAKPGVYTVTLDASNAGGTGLRNHAVTVVASSPVANFTYMPPAPAVGETVQFTDATTGGPTAWLWDFGDPGSGPSNTSTLQNPTHVFAHTGVYPLTLTVSNAQGAGTRTMNMTIQCSRCTRVVNFR